MNIMVFDVPAESGGALSVLNDFYNEVVESNDKSVNWIFVLSTPILKETGNIKVLRFPWIKKSWIHRLYFDHTIAPKLVKQYKVDKVFSLQNVTIPSVKCEQTLYVHQSLPFVDYKFSFKDNSLFWIYQNIIGRNIINSIKRAQYVIVQTEWMKNICIEKAQVESRKIKVIPPRINERVEKYFKPNEGSLSTFFYPASSSEYKNHKVIVDACLELRNITKINYEIIFTLNGNENQHIAGIFKQVHEEQLPIRFEGLKERRQVFDLYTKSVLLFPSFIETFGLPLLEAKMHRGVIFASDSNFSHEILDGYPNAYFFDPFKSEELAILIKNLLTDKIRYVEQPERNRIEIFDNNLINIVLGK